MEEKLEHPGSQIARLLLEPNGLSVTEAADALGVARNTLSRLINGRHGISADMAVRLAMVFGGEAERWMRLQTDYDLVRARANVSSEEIVPLIDTDSVRHRDVRVRRLSLGDETPGTDLRSSTPAELIQMVWPLTVDAWAFKEQADAQSRLPRNSVTLFRREGGVPVGWRVRARRSR